MPNTEYWNNRNKVVSLAVFAHFDALEVNRSGIDCTASDKSWEAWERGYNLFLCPDPTHVRARGSGPLGYTSPNPCNWVHFRIWKHPM